MGRMVLGAFGMHWWIDDVEDEVVIEPYRRDRLSDEDASWWVDWPWNVHLSYVRPKRELTDDEYQAIMSVLSGQTKEEWVARRQAEGKPISPVGEEKQD